MSLSRSYVHLYWRATRRLRLSINYDSFRRYWTYEYRSVADSVFDDRVRQGVRARLDWNASSAWRLGLGAGLRDRPDAADPTITYSLYVRRTRLFTSRMSASVNVSGFDGDGERGQNNAVQLGVEVPSLGHSRIRFARYRYTVQSIDETRSSWSVETGLDADIARHYFLSTAVQYNSGDDINGWRLNVEMGYRF
jgi:hypothetical protein